MADNKAKKAPMSQRKRILVFALCSGVALLFCMSVVMGVAFSLMTDGVYELDGTKQQSLSPAPQTPQQAVDFLASLARGATDDSVMYLKIGTSVSIDDETITLDGTESELKTIKRLKKTILENVDGMYPEDYTGSFGDGFKDYPTIELSEGDYTSAACQAGRLDDRGKPYDEDYYCFDITVNGVDYPAAPGGGVYETFNLGDVGEIAGLIKAQTQPLLDVVSFSIEPLDFHISANSNRFTDKLSYINLTRRYSVALTAAFKGDLAPIGEKTLGFEYCVQERFDYVWAGITCNESMTLKVGDSSKLVLNATLNDYSDYSVRMESSDESVATVDELGYVTAHKVSEEPVIITVYLDYLGHEYSAQCKVNVRKLVKKIKISDDTAQLKVGESTQISAELKPSDATDKDILWISDDESVATVTGGENGEAVILAVGVGQTIIRAVSDDGHYQDLCTVTVSG